MHGRYLFAGIENVKGYFLLDIAPVHEIEHPFRSCNHALYIHHWPKKAIVLGWWKKRYDETENLMRAVKGREYDLEKTYPAGLLRSSLSEGSVQIKTDEFS